MTIQNKRIFASVLFVLISFVSTAQGDVIPPPPLPPPPPPGFPIDGGLLVGILTAMWYGCKKIYSKKSV
jgi:hypothetical protein